MRHSITVFIFLFFFSCSSPENETDPTPVQQSTTEYTLTISSGTGGTVSTSGGTYEEGSTVNITATPNSEYVFQNWSNGSTDNPLTVTVNQNITLTANFIKRKYPLTINIQGEGTVSEEVVSSGKSTPTEYNSGTVVRLTADPSGNYEFFGWDLTSTSGSTSTLLNPLDINIYDSFNVSATFKEPILYKNNYPNYPEINLKSGTILNNIYSHKKLLLAEIIASKIELYDGCDCQGCGCQTKFLLSENNYRLLDFNNDNKPDFFGFLSNSSDGQIFRTSGKYVVIDDVFNEFNIKYFESNRWFAGNSILGDFNNDNQIEILTYSQEDHSRNDSEVPVSDKIPLSIIEISPQGEINVRDIGPPTATHDLTTLDIDNDGDIDILNFEYYSFDEPDHIDKPLVYINDGTGNFEVFDNLITLPTSFYDNPGDFRRLASDSFDLDNDGYLDVVSGGIKERGDTEGHPYNQGSEVLWGNQNNTFNYSESSSLEMNISELNEKVFWGFNFIDYNSDNNFDIVGVGVSDYGQKGFIEMYRNNGDRTFTHVTDSYFDVYLWNSRRSNSTEIIPIFYEISVIDVDNDGDYDLIPTNSIRGDYIADEISRSKPATGENFYWQNNNGFFTLIEDYYNIDPIWFERVYKTDCCQ
jgi:hypothetical protein